MACTPILKKNPEIRLRYGEFITYRVGDNRNTLRKLEIARLKTNFEIIMRSNIPDKDMVLQRIKQDIQIAENQLRFINAIRDRYFDKNGYLNPNKERVKMIFKAHTDTHKKVIRRYKLRRNKNLRKMTIKRNQIRRVK